MERGNSVNGISPGWYRDPVDPTVQRYWDGEGYLGGPLPADATPPPGPPANATPTVPVTPARATPEQAEETPGHPREAPGQPHQTPGQPQQMPGQLLQPPGQREQTPAQPPPVPGQSQQMPGQPQQTPGQPQQTPGQPQGTPIPTSPAGVANSAPTQVTGVPPVQQWPGQYTPGTHPTGAMPGWPAYPRLVLPAPRPHGYRLAGLGARFIARFVDILAVLGLNILVNGYFVYQYYKVNLPYWQEISRRFYAGESMSGVEPPERSSTLLVIVLILAAALWFAYEVPSHANTGQTLGKRLLGIKVMRLESDEALGFRRSMRRWNTLGLPTLLWTCFGLGFLLQFIDCLWAAVDRPMHQALHDKSAVTVVVQAEPGVKPEQQTQPNHDKQGRPA